MPQNPEAQAFLQRVVALPKGPGVSLDDVLQPSIDDETELRQLWASEKEHPRLKDAHVGLVDLFAEDTPDDIRHTRARIIKDDIDLSAKYVHPLPEEKRREEGTPCMVDSFEEFKKNWSIFSEGSLSQLTDWNNVVVAGGSVLACLAPLADEHKVSKRAIRKYYHSAAYPTSDIDLFLWGMNAEQAERKIQTIYEAVRDSVPWDVTCIRTKHTVSIHSQYPYRSVQIVLRLYDSPAQVLAGFDLDAPCVAFDGEHVWANPRAVVAMMRQCNTVDMSRRSPSYEVRLTKYASRGFEVFVPVLRRDEVDPTIYERAIGRMHGLARLLILEKLTTSEARYRFLESRRNLRGRPDALAQYNRRRQRRLKGDLKADADQIGGLEMNDYDVVSLHLPYGPGWNAKRVEKLVYQTDLGMNSTFNPKNKGRRLHRHPAFFGTAQECMDDCCECCPEPIDADERELQEKEDEQYIRGRIKFMEDHPDRQTMTGSFNPIDVGEWSEQVYIGAVEKLFTAIVNHDRQAVLAITEAEDFDNTRRDHVGRSPLHVAILCGAQDIACDLIDAGVRITARLADGKTALHMAAQYDQLAVIRKLLQRSAENEAADKKKKSDVAADEDDDKMDVSGDDPARRSSEDDWSSHDEDGMDIVDEDEADDEGDEDDEDDDDDSEGGKKNKKKEEEGATPPPTEAGELPEDEEEVPDVYDINILDFDLAFTPLFYAVMFAGLSVVSALLEGGADAKLVTKSQGYNSPSFHPLTLTILREDKSTACQIAERLITAGASATEADTALRTIFHHAVAHEQHELVKTFLRLDTNPKLMINFPSADNRQIISPLVTSTVHESFSMLARLVANGADLRLSNEDASRALEKFRQQQSSRSYYMNTDIAALISSPLESAIASASHIAFLLISLGAEVSVATKSSEPYRSSNNSQYQKTIVDWVEEAYENASRTLKTAEEAMGVKKERDEKEETKEAESKPAEVLHGCKKFMDEWLHPPTKDSSVSGGPVSWTYETSLPRRRQKYTDLKKAQYSFAYLEEVLRVLHSMKAKTWKELYENGSESDPAERMKLRRNPTNIEPFNYVASKVRPPPYYLLTSSYHRNAVPLHTYDLYDELYEAAFSGDNAKIQELCVPENNTSDRNSILQIAVEFSDGSEYSRTGLTPLSIAILQRKWDTARLILAIATAQYKAEDKKFTLDIDFEGDSDSDRESDYDSDAQEEAKPAVLANFTDIAKKASAIQCDCPPLLLLTQTISWTNKKSTDCLTKSSTPLLKAIYEDDLETFSHVVDLYTNIGERAIDKSILDTIIATDHPDILDEFIRRTGQGVNIVVPHGGDDITIAVNDKNRIYLGLNINGKKRADLAKRIDPDSNHSAFETFSIPLVWQAIKAGSLKIVDYLRTDRPLNAYRFYSKSHGDERALRLRRQADLDTVLPVWLGWTITALRESPLTAAIMSGELKVIKRLFTIEPKLMGAALHEKIKFTGFNALMLAVVQNVDVPIFDFLYKKGLSPADLDHQRGFNIYHILVNACPRSYDLLEHVLKTLPKDVTEALMKQQSMKYQNTPLHLAVEGGQNYIIKLILPYSQAAHQMRDSEGCTPLHIAVRHGYSQTVTLLLENGPIEALYTENAVGETPLETACLRNLLHDTRDHYQSAFEDPTDMQVYNPRMKSCPFPDEYALRRLQKQLPLFRKTLDELIEDGKLKRGTKITTELLSFASMMEARLAAKLSETDDEAEVLKLTDKEKEEEEKEKRFRNDTEDRRKTYDVICDAIRAEGAKNPSRAHLPRYLVHLSDVQLSVQTALNGSLDSPNYGGYYGRRRGDEDEDMESEEDEETKLKATGMTVLSYDE